MPLPLVLIEDHRALREGLELLLSREGCEVVGAAGDAASGRATHIRNAMNKLEAHTRVHAIAIALREGFISPPADAGAARG